MRYSLLILGGSSIYTLLFLNALEANHLLSYFNRITLFGRNKDKLTYIAAFANRIVATAHEKISVDYALNFDQCIKEDYNIIINQIRFGGLKARNIDEQLAIKYGLFADETLGIVGVSNAIRTITSLKPFLEKLADTGKEFLFLNFTNPCSIVSQYILEYYHCNVIGLCDYPNVFKNRIAEFLEYSENEISIQYFGLNHFSFVFDILYKNHSLFDLFKSKISAFPYRFKGQHYFDYICIPSWENIFYKEKVIEAQITKYGKKNRASELMDIEDTFMTYIHSSTKDQRISTAVPSLLFKRNCQWYETGVVPFFKVYFGIDPDKSIIINTSSNDIFGLGRTKCIVEANAMIDNGRVKLLEIPERIKKSSQFLYVTLMKKAELCLLDGILEKNAEKIYQACLINPMIQEGDKIKKYFNELSERDSAIRLFLRESF